MDKVYVPVTFDDNRSAIRSGTCGAFSTFKGAQEQVFKEVIKEISCSDLVNPHNRYVNDYDCTAVLSEVKTINDVWDIYTHISLKGIETWKLDDNDSMVNTVYLRIDWCIKNELHKFFMTEKRTTEDALELVKTWASSYPSEWYTMFEPWGIMQPVSYEINDTDKYKSTWLSWYGVKEVV